MTRRLFLQRLLFCLASNPLDAAKRDHITYVKVYGILGPDTWVEVA